MRPESTSSGSVPGVSAAVCVTPLALVDGRVCGRSVEFASASSFGASSFDLLAFSPLLGRFAALPLSALAVAVFAAAVADWPALGGVVTALPFGPFASAAPDAGVAPAPPVVPPAAALGVPVARAALVRAA